MPPRYLDENLNPIIDQPERRWGRLQPTDIILVPVAGFFLYVVLGLVRLTIWAIRVQLPPKKTGQTPST
jgi:hypothetical protein